MNDLVQYILAHTQRTECRCAQCIDARQGPSPKPGEHTVNMIFFEVSPTEPADVDAFRRLTSEALFGAYATVDPFDGKEHSYLELGTWIGDQGLAMQYMALGVMLGVFTLLTPVTVFRLPTDHPVVMEMAHGGFIAVASGG